MVNFSGSNSFDPDLAQITLSKPDVADTDIVGKINITFPGNLNVFYNSDKTGGTVATEYLPSELPKSFYLEGIEASSAILDQHIEVEMTLDSGVKCEDEIHYTVLKSDMILHNGLDGWSGGQVLAEKDEEVKGAVTVANLNDTNSNGAKDIDDSVVTGEKDLMKIILEQPKPNTLPGKVRIRIVSGNVKIYSDSTKAGGEVTLEQPVSAFSADSNGNNNNDLVWWVEARSASSLKGIDLRYEYQPSDTANWIETDKVKATSVWVSFTRAWHERQTSPGFPDNPVVGPGNDLPDLDEPSLVNRINIERIAKDGSRYGSGTFRVVSNQDTKIGGRILLEFSITPKGKDSHLLNGVKDLGVIFDLTRQKERLNRRIIIGNPSIQTDPAMPDVGFPNDDEAPNDEQSGIQYDEDNDPSTDPYLIYAWDAPSKYIQVNPPVIAFYIKRYNFFDYARVKFGGTFSNNNNTVEGSRASYKQRWHFLSYLRSGTHS